jgi:hypothetical protein
MIMERRCLTTDRRTSSEKQIVLPPPVGSTSRMRRFPAWAERGDLLERGCLIRPEFHWPLGCAEC